MRRTAVDRAAGAVRRPGPSSRASAAVAFVAIALLAAGCATPSPEVAASEAPTSATPGSPTPSDGAEQLPSGAAETTLSEVLDHVHGLVVVDDGTLRAGTHTGVVAVTGTGSVSRIGTSRDDLMGMTGVPGTDLLATSGHPGAGSSLPNPVGLVLSDDAGLTWSAISLTGEVDFHALATDGTLLVGYGGGGRVLKSTDGGATFAPGGSLAPAALAINPAGVWATTADGLQRSTDRGSTFEVVDDAPVLVLIASGPDGSLWGVDTAGVAWRSLDGNSWEERAVVGPVEALAVAEHATAYAMTATALFTLT